MEIGFEVVHCDFNTSMNLVNVTRSFLLESQLGSDELQLYQLARAIQQQFDGIRADRLHIDFSAMVSGFFFPINISSTDRDRPDLIRLGAASADELKAIKSYLHNVSLQPRRFTVDWQAVVDTIVSRFADRLALMASDKLSSENFMNELDKVVLTYVDAQSLPEDVTAEYEKHWAAKAVNRCPNNLSLPALILPGDQCPRENETTEAINRCARHYLIPALFVQDEWSHEDSLIHTAIGTVAGHICHNLFQVRSSLADLSFDAADGGDHISKDRNREAVDSGSNF